MPREFNGESAVEAYFTASRLTKFSPDENEKYNSDMRNEWEAINKKEFSREEGREENDIAIPIIAKCIELTEEQIKNL